MKKTLAILYVIIFAMQGCQPEEEVNIESVEVQFGFTLPGSSSNGRLESTETPASILVIIEDDEGSTVFSNEEIELIPFGNSFASNPIQLSPGEYFLTSFLVLNNGDTAIHAAPLEGSVSADLIDDPLPIEFSVVQNDVTNVTVEVLRIEDSDPSIFGYASFIPVFVPTFQFQIVVFEADTITGNIQTTDADLFVTSGSDTLRSSSLSAGVNLVTITDELVNYTITVAKGSFDTFSQTLTLAELQVFAPGNPLEVILSPGSGSTGTTSGTFINSGQVILISSQGIALGDLDSDGDVDALLTDEFSTANTNVWLNNGNGFFEDSNQTLGVRQSTDVELADLDGDGDLDAFITRLGSSDPQASGSTVWLNDGNGNFTDSGQRLGNERGLSVSIGDLDSDEDLDAFVTNQFANNIIWLNNGSGQFNSNLIIVSDPQSSNTSFDGALADFDGDNDLDLVFTGAGVPNQVLFNNGISGFENSFTLSNDVFRVVKSNDFDGDGDLDVVLLNGGSLINQIHFNDGTGRFTSESFNTTVSFSNADVADIDGDGDLDIVGAVGLSISPSIVLLNNGDGSFIESQFILPDVGTGDVQLADLNRDGIIDAFFANDNVSSVFFGQP